MLSVMYHLINEPTTEFPSIKALHPEEFRGQLDYLVKHHQPLQFDDLVACIKERRKIPANSFSLTFDHGTKDHMEIVLPELERRGLQGMFYIMTQVLQDRRIPWIEKQRYMEAHYPRYRDFLEHFVQTCLGLVPEHKAEIEPSAANFSKAGSYLSQFGFYSVEERFFRKVRDEVVDRPVFVEVVGKMFADAFADESGFLESHFLSVDDLKELKNKGMVIGSHGHGHLFFDQSPAEICQSDISRSFDFLDSQVGPSVRSMTYPNGRYAPHLEQILDDHSVEVAFTTEPTLCEVAHYRYRIPRFDTTALPTSGDAPICEFSARLLNGA